MGLAVPVAPSTMSQQLFLPCSREGTGAGCPELPVGATDLWAPLQERLLGMAHPACPREPGPGRAPGVPCVPPASPIPSPAFLQMLGLEDETALLTPVPTVPLSLRFPLRRLDVATQAGPGSDFVRLAPCSPLSRQEQAGGHDSGGEALNSSPPAPKSPGPPLP